MNGTEENDSLCEMFRQAMPDDLPAPIEQRLEQRLMAFRKQLDAESAVAGSSRIRRLFRPGTVDRAADIGGPEPARRWKRASVAVAGIAAAIFVSVWLWTCRESRLWAQVVDAVRAKPWVHAVAKPGGGEMWLSMDNAVAAHREGDWALYDDGRLRVRHEYDPAQKQLYRLPLDGGLQEDIRSMQMVFTGIFRRDDNLGPKFGRERVTRQQRRSISAQGREWIEYALTVEGASRAMRVVFRVDPETRLPQSIEYFDASRPQANTKARSRFVLDYPQDGPLDIFALGVPRSAQVIDRVPKPDLARVLDGVRTSRKRFADSYYAIVVHGQGEWWQNVNVHQVWCKGDCWRVELGALGKSYEDAKPPAAGTNQLTWWKERLKKFDFSPIVVCDGRAILRAKHVAQGSEMNRGRGSWETMRKINPGEGNLPAASVGDAGTYMPDFYAYPTSLCEPGRHTIAELTPNPSDELLQRVPGAVLVGYRLADQADPDACPAYRYCVDPARSYVALRSEMGEGPDAKAESDVNWPDTYVAEEYARTPTGIWYPTVVRRLWPGQVTPPAKRGNTVYWFFVDFKADMPDSLFQAGPLPVKAEP